MSLPGYSMFAILCPEQHGVIRQLSPTPDCQKCDSAPPEWNSPLLSAASAEVRLLARVEADSEAPGGDALLAAKLCLCCDLFSRW